ncbi:MAG TPA: NAD(P)/FAD-dependent oxidoreductase [Longimicrobiales bacterium]|nr:NAD(P)/FAD-dependent oxidoreductase [Longimicrobiales bacterium]
MAEAPVVVVGAGPAGLAAAHELRVRRIPFRLLERGSSVGASWTRLYDSLRLHTGKHLSALPGLRFGRDVPLFPTRDHFVDYLERYARRFALDAETGTSVTRIDHDGRWLVRTTGEAIEARAVVIATGIISEPVVPDIAGRADFQGRVLHSVEYRRPAPFAGRRALVVGVGNSGGEIGSELARAGVDTTIAVRSGANVVPLTIMGIPIQYLSVYVRKLPRPVQEQVVAMVGRISEKRRGPPVLPRTRHSPLDAIPLIGFHLVDEIRAGRIAVRPAIERFTPSGVRFSDGTEEAFDDVILATGFRAALGPVEHLVRRDQKGFALRTDRVRSADNRCLYFVGQNYDSSGGLQNIARDAPLAARAIEEDS